MTLNKHLKKLVSELKREFDYYLFEANIFGDDITISVNFKKEIEINNNFIEEIEKILTTLKKYGFMPFSYGEVILNSFDKKYFVLNRDNLKRIDKSINSIDFKFYFGSNKKWEKEFKEMIIYMQNTIDNNRINIDNLESIIDDHKKYYFLIVNKRTGEKINSIEKSEVVRKGRPIYIYLIHENNVVSLIDFHISIKDNVFVVNKVYTLPSFRRKGYSYILHKFIQDKTGMKYDSDLEFTKKGFLHMISNRNKIISERIFVKKNMKYIKTFESFEQPEGTGVETFWETEIDGDTVRITFDDVIEQINESIEIDPNDIKQLLIDVERDPSRVEAADLNYPIILVRSEGEFISILDGQHRVVKAIRDDVKIKAKVLDLDLAPEKFVKVFRK